MGLVMFTLTGSNFNLANYFQTMNYTSSSADGTNLIYHNGFGKNFIGATWMVEASSGLSGVTYDPYVYLGHGIVQPGAATPFSFLVDAVITTDAVDSRNIGRTVVETWNGLADLLSYDDALTGNAGNDLLEGYRGSDRLVGDAGDDVLIGDTGNDSLDGGFGADVLLGGEGNDAITGGFGADRISGGAGVDVAAYLGSFEAVTISLADRTASGGDAMGDRLTDIESLSGSDYDDVLTGDGSANALTGRAGSDTLSGGANDDLLSGGAGADALDGGDGLDTASYVDSPDAITVNLTTGTARGSDAHGDTLIGIENVTGGFGNDTLIGTSGDNVLIGGGGNDMLIGGKGNDLLDGGNNRDTMTGGAGKDIFKPYGGDVVTDYTDGADKISFVGAFVRSFDQLTITAGDDTNFPGSAVIKSPSGYAFLLDTDYRLLDASDFIFDSAAVPHGSPAMLADWLASADGHLLCAHQAWV